VGLTGVAAGLFGALLMLVLHAVEHLAFGASDGTFTDAVLQASPARRIVALLAVGLVGGVGWFLLRRLAAGESTHVDDEIWTGRAILSFRRSLGTGLLSELVVGGGASLGREASTAAWRCPRSCRHWRVRRPRPRSPGSRCRSAPRTGRCPPTP
jgi:H+/Cl- antiporter ClcA